MSEDLEGAKRAQQRVWDLQEAGAAPNSPQGRQAVNHLMTRLRHLSESGLAAFEAWKAERGSSSEETEPG
jgi:hypothetical protein